MSFSMIVWNQNVGKKAKLCQMDTDSFTIFIKAEDIYVEISKYVETRFATSNYELSRPLLKRKTEKVVELMTDELGGKKWQMLQHWDQKHKAI